MKTGELRGSALDWAVAKCARPHLHPEGTRHVTPSYSTSWSLGGPIIENKFIDVYCYERDLNMWVAECRSSDGGLITSKGKTALVAAMRCYVASKLGDEIEIPEELK